MKKIALAIAPFHNCEPCIQIGVLKPYLELNGFEVDDYYFNLPLIDAIEPLRYNRLLNNDVVGEGIFASRLFPENNSTIEALLLSKIDIFLHKHHLEYNGSILLHELTDEIFSTIDPIIGSVDWPQYGMVCFSLTYHQLFPSIYFARSIKKRYPEIPIVMGGALCIDELGYSLLDLFDCIDVVVSGGGEIPLVRLAHYYCGGQRIRLEEIEGVITRNSTLEQIVKKSEITDMDDLPVPDYSGFFRERDKYHKYIKAYTEILIPLEASRGCPWTAKSGGCSFCNLSVVFKRFRKKSTDRIIEEMQEQISRYGVKDFYFTDNTFNCRNIEYFVDRIKESDLDITFSVELRANVKYEELILLKSAGLKAVQVGVEALSAGVLKRVNKGTTVLDNIRTMKYCEELDLENNSNLITGLPGTTDEEIAETMSMIKAAYSYRYLQESPFTYSYKSAFYNELLSQNPHLKPKTSMKMYLPAELHDRMRVISFSVDEGPSIWDDVSHMLFGWQQFYMKYKKRYGNILICYLHDYFIEIVDLRINGRCFYEGDAMQVFLTCNHPKSLEDIKKLYTNVEESRLSQILKDFTRNNIMFYGSGMFFSLPIIMEKPFWPDYSSTMERVE